MILVDASAIVAIMTREPDAVELARKIEADPEPATNPMAIFEAALAVSRKHNVDVDRATRDVKQFLFIAGIRTIPITAADTDTALAAHARFGKGRGHPARLNMADCFAYATARNNGLALLFAGSDLSHTDIKAA